MAGFKILGKLLAIMTMKTGPHGRQIIRIDLCRRLAVRMTGLAFDQSLVDLMREDNFFMKVGIMIL